MRDKVATEKNTLSQASQEGSADLWVTMATGGLGEARGLSKAAFKTPCAI